MARIRGETRARLRARRRRTPSHFCTAQYEFLVTKALTIVNPQDYIRPLGAPPPWRDGAAWKPLTVYAVNHPAMCFGHDGCAGFGGFPLSSLPSEWGVEGRGKRGRKVPGCLTSESEERETWTAESLRAASSNGEGFRQNSFFARRCGRKRLRRSTFQVNTMIVTVSNHRNGQSGTSSNVVISREKFSSNLRV
jgi:hypothetical protein